MEKYKILVVDDEEVIRNSLAEWLTDTGYESLTAADGPQALNIIKDADIDIMLADLKMPGMDGMQLMKQAQEINPDLSVIIMTAYGTIASAIDAIKAGAYDYLEKPFCPERVEVIINNIMAHKNVVRENIALKKELSRKYQFEELVGKSPKMQAVFELIKTVAKSNATVLILGETGTGKELVARAVHAESLRHKGPFVSLNCAALPESLLESELFGHEKGSFTGAIAQKKGKFELAHGGTIFLDEIGDISPNVQVHLLRVLQEKELNRVGGNEIVKVDVRVVTSTNRDLKKRVEEGTFREDLFYRLNVVPVYVPPLRERPDDIPILARYFLKKFNTENNKNIRDFSPEVMDYFMKHTWTGNVRELENAIEYSVVLCRNDIVKPEHLPPLLKDRRICEPPPSANSDKTSLKDAEKKQIIKVLDENKWNYTRTAKTLGISRSTLHNKLKEYQITKK
ncbi:MAG: sigma-54-dependent Fis family transcriptional regulator [Planctomycetes bacterium]|nr:sigma-54-dependent Fis family transcriptional regulator [Planctomycetota bacterium]